MSPSINRTGIICTRIYTVKNTTYRSAYQKYYLKYHKSFSFILKMFASKKKKTNKQKHTERDNKNKLNSPHCKLLRNWTFN